MGQVLAKQYKGAAGVAGKSGWGGPPARGNCDRGEAEPRTSSYRSGSDEVVETLYASAAPACGAVAFSIVTAGRLWAARQLPPPTIVPLCEPQAGPSSHAAVVIGSITIATLLPAPLRPARRNKAGPNQCRTNSVVALGWAKAGREDCDDIDTTCPVRIRALGQLC